MLASLSGRSTSDTPAQPQPGIMGPKERAEAELKRYLEQRIEELPLLVDYPLTASLRWWGKEGKERFPPIATLARSLLAIKPAAGHLEQDFSLAGFMCGPKRSSLEPAYVDMTLTLKSLQPDEVPRMEKVKPVVDRQAAIPQRYKDREALEIMNQLDEPCDGDTRGQVQALD